MIQEATVSSQPPITKRRLLPFLLGGGSVIVITAIVAFLSWPAPKVHGALRGHEVEIAKNGEIRVIFSQRMQKTSAEKAFRIQPSVQGTFRWEDNILIYKSNNDLEKSKRYVVQISTDAKNLFGKSLLEPFEQIFLIIDAPEVTVVTPPHERGIRPKQAVSVLFDRPIRTPSFGKAIPEYLQISPNVKGTYRWLGTYGFEFLPQDEWPAAQTFQVTIPKETKTVDGGSLREDYFWSFSTDRLRVWMYGQNANRSSKEPIRLQFNYALDPQSVAAAIKILDMHTSSSLPQAEFDFSQDAEDPKIIVIKKKTGQTLGMDLVFSLPQDFHGNLGPRGLEQDWSGTFKTDDPFFELLTSCPSGVENYKIKYVDDPLTLVFNNKIDPTELEKRLRITPLLESQTVTPYAWSNESNCFRLLENGKPGVSISGNWKPSTTYTVTIDDKAKDVYEQTLKKIFLLTFDTSPYTARIDFSSFNSQGILAHHLPHVYQFRALNTEAEANAELRACESQSFLGMEENACASAQQKSYNTTAALNTYKIVDVNLDEVSGRSLSPGLYYLAIRHPDILNGVHARWFALTNVALTIKRDNEGKILVWATDNQSGQPVASLSIQLFDVTTDYSIMVDQKPKRTVQRILSGKTDHQGIATFALPKDRNFSSSNLWVLAQDAQHVGISSMAWQSGIQAWNYNLAQDWRKIQPRHIGYVYTDRMLYRPDQRVYFKGVVRGEMDAALSLPKQDPVEVAVENPSGTELTRLKLPISDFGTFHGSFQLEPNMELGAYVIRVLDLDKADSSLTGVFEVREYRRPDFRVAVTAPTGDVTEGQTITLPIRASYYHGVPLAKAHATYVVTRANYFFQPMQGEWYNFAQDDLGGCYWDCPTPAGNEEVARGEGVLDEQGNLTVSFPATLGETKQSATYFVTVTVQDLNKREVSANIDFPVHQGLFYIGLRPDYSTGWNGPLDFGVTTVLPNGQQKPNIALTLTLFRREWKSVQKEDTNGVPTWMSQHEDMKVESQDIKMDETGKAEASFSTTKDGEYVLVAEAKDDRGHTIYSSTNRYLFRQEGGVYRVTDDHHLRIVQSKADYQVGETASLLVQTPYPKTKALITTERGRLLDYAVIDLDPKQQVVEVPIKESSAPNLYVSVLTVKGGGKKDLPEFRMGYADLRVDLSQKKLQVDLKPDKTQYRPGETVTVHVETKRTDGKPTEAELSLAVVDEKIIAFLGPIDKNILGYFWYTRFLGVETAQTLTELVRKRFYSTEGGGGGKGDGDQAAPAIRGNFLDTAFWKADIRTDKNGKATASFRLPDNLTSWQLLAIGATKDTVVGSAETTIQTKRDLMIEPAVPRILRKGDEAVLGATIHNTTNAQLDAKIDFKLTGSVVTENAPATISLAPKSRKTLSWNIRVPVFATSTAITLFAKAQDKEDGFSISIPVLDASTPETVTASGILKKNVTEQIQIPDGIIKDMGQLRLTVAPSIGRTLSASTVFLSSADYKHVESISSALRANVLLLELAKKHLTELDATQTASATERVLEGIKRLVSLQQPDGGWGFWQEYRSGAFITSHVFESLLLAEKAGFVVDTQTLVRAEEYLFNALSFPSTSIVWSRQLQTDILYALAQKRPDRLEGYTQSLYEHREDLSQIHKLRLALTWKLIDINSQTKSLTLLDDVKTHLTFIDPSRAYIAEDLEWKEFLPSDVSASAWYLRALLEFKPSDASLDPLAHQLLRKRKDSAWENTFDTSAVLWAFVRLAESRPVETQKAVAAFFLNNAFKQEFVFPKGDLSSEQTVTLPLTDLLKTQALHQIGLESDAKNPSYYNIAISVYQPFTSIEPFDQGFSVISEYYTLDDKKLERPLFSIKQGETMLGRLRVIVPKERWYVGVEHHLPAGLELVDLDYGTSARNLEGKEESCEASKLEDGTCMTQTNWEWDWWWENVWRHIEKRDDRLFLSAETLRPGVYDYRFLVQAITPGYFHTPPTRAFELFHPDGNGHNEAKMIKVVP